uniref:(northern house mosquito) hypothetical protein n=1 Tax=Culex pipiens TaxID=7175 RepID=A0A8D8AQR1_CULPI
MNKSVPRDSAKQANLCARMALGSGFHFKHSRGRPVFSNQSIRQPTQQSLKPSFALRFYLQTWTRGVPWRTSCSGGGGRSRRKSPRSVPLAWSGRVPDAGPKRATWT